MENPVIDFGMKIVIFIIVFLTTMLSNGQTIVLENLHNNELTLGARNIFNIGTNGLDCSSIKVVTSNGSIKVDTCTLELVPDTLGICILTFYQAKTGDSIFLTSKKYRVKKLKKPEPMMYHRKEGKLSLNAILKGKIELENNVHACDIGIDLPLKEFKILIIRNGEFVGYSYNDGSIYNKESTDLVMSAKAGDKILFFDIIGKNYYKEFEKLDNLEFEVQ